jgi:hypothetical protein
MLTTKSFDKQHFHMPSRVQRGTALFEQAHEVLVAAGLESRPLLAPAPAQKRQRNGKEEDEAADTVAYVGRRGEPVRPELAASALQRQHAQSWLARHKI